MHQNAKHVTEGGQLDSNNTQRAKIQAKKKHMGQDKVIKH